MKKGQKKGAESRWGWLKMVKLVMRIAVAAAIQMSAN